MTTTSQWRLRARQVIRRTLDALPADATEAQKRKAVRDAYPFGERKMHPYRCWLQEVKATFTTGPAALPLLDPPFIAFWHQRRPWWLTVGCRWCHNAVPGGCLVCLPLHQRVTALVTSFEWHAWVEAVRQDWDAKGPWSDWLEGRGDADDVADLVRRTEQVACPTCKGKGWVTGRDLYGSPPHSPKADRKFPCTTCDAAGLVLRTQGGEPC